LPRIVSESFASSPKDVSLEKVQLVSQLINQLLLRLDGFCLLAGCALQLIQLHLQTIDGRLLCFDQHLASRQVVGKRGFFDAHP